MVPNGRHSIWHKPSMTCTPYGSRHQLSHRASVAECASVPQDEMPRWFAALLAYLHLKKSIAWDNCFSVFSEFPTSLLVELGISPNPSEHWLLRFMVHIFRRVTTRGISYLNLHITVVDDLYDRIRSRQFGFSTESNIQLDRWNPSLLSHTSGSLFHLTSDGQFRSDLFSSLRWTHPAFSLSISQMSWLVEAKWQSDDEWLFWFSTIFWLFMVIY